MHQSLTHRMMRTYDAESSAREKSRFYTSFRKLRFVIVEDLTSFTLHDNDQKSKRGFFAFLGYS